jgi:hypothetical protein
MMDNISVIADTAISLLSLSNYPHYPQLTRTLLFGTIRCPVPINNKKNDNYNIYRDGKSALSLIILFEVIAHYQIGYSWSWLS